MSLDALPFEVKAIRRYRASCLDFMRECVWTQDQVDKKNPVKQYPLNEGWAKYLEFIIEHMVKECLLAIVKHRRMIITWTYCAVTTWDAMFYEGRFNALVSKKEEDSDDLVRRCKFIYENIPADKLPVKPSMTYKYTEMRFPETDSVIKGVASGQDQLRQYTCSRVGCDEMAFWPLARPTFTALKPTLDGGGQICLFSTRYPGFFQNVIDDTIDEEAVA